MRLHSLAALLSIMLLPSLCLHGGKASASDLVYSFTGGTDGAHPLGGVVAIKRRVYGTTLGGGQYGNGAVYSLTDWGFETVVYSFAAGSDGDEPAGTLITDGSGNLYGTTIYEGDATCRCGIVFKVTTGGKETVLYRFKGGSGDGAYPFGAVVMDGAGNLYGTTSTGGDHNSGTLFRLAPDGTETVLHSFGGTDDGSDAFAGPIIDGRGNLYGTTVYGGRFNLGTVWEYTARGKEKVLYSFGARSDDGTEPYASLLRDKSGNLYGTATGYSGMPNAGTVFEITPDGTEDILYAFSGGNDGCAPAAPLIRDKNGNMFGTATGCGLYFGTVFEIEAGGGFKLIYQLTGDDGFEPNGLYEDKSGGLWGTSYYGGRSTNCHNGCGAVFKVIQ
jgi:uncharacterized repeat protein (TIGR03803 family)